MSDDLKPCPWCKLNGCYARKMAVGIGGYRIAARTLADALDKAEARIKELENGIRSAMKRFAACDGNFYQDGMFALQDALLENSHDELP